ncbi:hypothetical protein CPE01_08470 [Cellulomonas persica]|uniref:DUF306 domain-containing protein n=1 Tax=Cellulomonas persica TaxID=76861 RepID=A0A510UR27_9CELL|nr:hypothetical protein CPE01_08470 [Cellulomonas persica]
MSVRTHAVVPDASTHDPAGDGQGQGPRDEPARLASLTFDGDGQVFGTGGVNRLRGTWSIDGDRLAFGPIASTLMAGPPAAMRQEAELLRLLGEGLVLRTAGGSPHGVADPLLDRAAGTPAPVVELVAPTGERLVLTRVDAAARR